MNTQADSATKKLQGHESAPRSERPTKLSDTYAHVSQSAVFMASKFKIYEAMSNLSHLILIKAATHQTQY